MFAAGFRPGDIAINTFSYHMVPFALNMVDNSLRRLRCVTIPTGVGNTEQQVHILQNLKVNAFCGTPSFLLNIAEKAAEMGLDLKRDLSLRVGFVAAEMLPESLRSQLEETFGMTIRQSDGTADIGCLGYECIEKNGMHVPNDKILEIVDPQTGKQLEPGEAGEIVATAFNQVYPLIRFGTGDLSNLTGERCPSAGRSWRATPGAPRLARPPPDMLALLRSRWLLGFRHRGRTAYWRFIWSTLLQQPRQMPHAIELSIFGHHYRRVAARLQ